MGKAAPGLFADPGRGRVGLRARVHPSRAREQPGIVASGRVQGCTEAQPPLAVCPGSQPAASFKTCRAAVSLEVFVLMRSSDS